MIATYPATVVRDSDRNTLWLKQWPAPDFEIGLDVETDTPGKEPNPMKDDLVGVGVSFYNPGPHGEHVATLYGDVKRTPWFLDLLRETIPYFAGYYAHNALYDTTVLRRFGVHTPTLLGDGRIAAYLLGQPEAGLKPLLEEWYGFETLDFVELLARHDATKISEVPIEAVADYCGRQDAQLCVPLARDMAAKLPDRVRAVYEKVELPMVQILLDMTMRGIQFNREAALPMLESATKARDGLDQVIAKMIRDSGFVQVEMKNGEPYARRCDECHNGKKKREGCIACKGQGVQAYREVAFNSGSPMQVREWLYEFMGFPRVRFASHEGKPVQPWMITKGLVDPDELNGSTDALALLQMQHRHSVIPVMLSRRKFQKEVGFVRSWLTASEDDGRIHTQFTNATVLSGRLSSHDPNLQQVQLKHRVLFEADPMRSLFF